MATKKQKKEPEEINELVDAQEQIKLANARLAGYMLRNWLPDCPIRKAIMLGLFVLGVYGIAIDNSNLILWWLLIPLFSPRAVGEVAVFAGRVSRYLTWKIIVLIYLIYVFYDYSKH